AARIVCVLAHFRSERRPEQNVALLWRLIGKAAVSRHQRKKRGRFAVQPIRAPVRRQVPAMTPNGSLLHSTARLPDLLAPRHVLAAVNDVAGFGLHDVRDRWCLLIGFPPES